MATTKTSPEIEAASIAAADRDQVHEHELELKFAEKGYSRHTTTGPFGSSTSWEKPLGPEVNAWAVVAFLAVIAVFFLILVKGWPF